MWIREKEGREVENEEKIEEEASGGGEERGGGKEWKKAGIGEVNKEMKEGDRMEEECERGQEGWRRVEIVEEEDEEKKKEMDEDKEE